MPQFCIICQTANACNIPSHPMHIVHDNYRLPRHTQNKLWQQIRTAIENEESLPLWENRQIPVPAPGCSCGVLHSYRAIRRE